jgi:hypothetical protein
MDPDPDPCPTIIGNIKKFQVLKSWMSFLRAEGFSYSLDVLYGSK